MSQAATGEEIMLRMAGFDEIREQYIHRTGKAPFDFSHWDAGSQYRDHMLSTICIEPIGNRFEYIFSHTLPQQLIKDIACKLGIAEHRKLTITPSGTTANVLAIATLATLGIKRLIIAGPCYFHVPEIAKTFGMEVNLVDVWDPSHGMDFEKLTEICPESDALWVTNPVYCFNTYYSEKSIAVLRYFLNTGLTVVADECNCISGLELGRHYSGFENFIGTYSPHKSLCINGIKFGAAIHGNFSELIMRHLSDCWVGPLPASIISDLKHFVSRNFSDLSKSSSAHTENTAALIENLAHDFPVTIYDGRGHFRVVSFDLIPRTLETSSAFFRAVMFATGLSYIPMSLNHGSTNLGFSFRVNLLANRGMLIHEFSRLVEYFNASAAQNFIIV